MKNKNTKSNTKFLSAKEARQNVLDKHFTDIIHSIEYNSKCGNSKCMKSLPSELSDDIHNLIISSLKGAGYDVKVIDSDNRTDNIEIGW
jgi:uncharacterized protein (UPF0335 family)